MIRVLMLDLGETLVHGDETFPHVPEALEIISGFETAAGEPLRVCLVSDFTMPSAPGNAAQIASLFAEYVALLEGFGLKRFFEPVRRRVTLSTHAGVRKPERPIFEKALQRLGVSAALDECLFVTEHPGHIAFCREQFGMATLQFDATGAGGDFDDWREAPLLINQLVAPESGPNAESALRAHLSATEELELISMKKEPAGKRVRGRAKKWVAVPREATRSREQLHVPVDVDVEVSLDKKGRVKSVKGGQPDPDTVKEAAHYVKTLDDNRQIAHDADSAPPDATHEVETDRKGRKRLVRKRFSAF